MTCKDCIHYNVCNMYDGPYISVHFNHTCKYFTDKQLVVFLPCKVGGKVYQVIPKCNVPYYKCAFNGGIGTDRCEDCNAFIREKKFEYCDIKNINITIFSDKSKAEAKLKELNEECL